MVDRVVAGAESIRDAVNEVLDDPNNSYSRNELKAASIRLKKLFGG